MAKKAVLDPEIAELPLNAEAVGEFKKKLGQYALTNGLAAHGELLESLQRNLTVIQFKPGMGGDPQLNYDYLFKRMGAVVSEAAKNDSRIAPDEIMVTLSALLMAFSESYRENMPHMKDNSRGV